MHLYIHVPFCARRCSYCDFAIAVRRNTPSREFLQVVLREWERWQRHPGWLESPELETVYLGGGTPSRLEPEVLGDLLGRLGADRPLSRDAEITIEANPEDVTLRTVESWLAAGINRVSLGAQSFSPAALAWMHRTHTAAQIARAVEAVRAAGARNVSLDLIYGLPDAVVRDWIADREHALALAPAHLSLYGLTVEPRTPLARWIARGQTVPAPDERSAREYLAAHERLARAGYEHYEVSNAARPGFRSRHNQAYWSRRPYLGIGPSAHSGFGRTRSWNLPAWEEYRARLLSGESATAGAETLDDVQVALEELYLGLRTDGGIAAASLDPVVARTWQEAGWAVGDSGRVRLTAAGWLRLDALVASLTHC